MNARLTSLIAAAKTSELAEFYNFRAVKPVTKFADRKTAEARVLREIEGLVAQGRFCPFCGKIHTDSIDAQNITAAGVEGTKGADRHLCHDCGTEYNEDGTEYKAKAKGETNLTRSAAIAASWDDEAVRAARSARIHIHVEGYGDFRSVGEAFRALGLPMSKHIAFRGQLRAASQLEFAGLKFSVKV